MLYGLYTQGVRQGGGKRRADEKWEFAEQGGGVVAPDGSGMGIEVDWDSLATADFHDYEIPVSPERK